MPGVLLGYRRRSHRSRVGGGNGRVGAGCDRGGCVDHLRRGLIALLCWLLCGTVFAETIPATTASTVPSQDAAGFGYAAVYCGGVQQVAASDYVYASRPAAAAAIPQAGLNAYARNYIGGCGLPQWTGRFAGMSGDFGCFDVLNDGTPAYTNICTMQTTSGVGHLCPEGYGYVGGGTCFRAASCPSDGTGWVLNAGAGTCTRPDQCPTGAQPCSVGVDSEAAASLCSFRQQMTAEQWKALPSTTGGACRGGCPYSVTKGSWISGTGYFNVVNNGGGAPGTSCTGDVPPSFPSSPNQPPPPPPPEPTTNRDADCIRAGGSPGVAPGTGDFLCLPRGSTPSTTQGPATTTTTTNPDGTITQTTSQPVTTCAGGVCTTTTTTTTNTYPAGSNPATATPISSTTTTVTGPGRGSPNSGGSGGSTGTGTDGTGLCDPSKQRCGEDGGNGFGGSCEAGFTCEGDAIQCAIAQEQYRRNCQMLSPKKGPNNVAMSTTEAEAEFEASARGLKKGDTLIPKSERDVSSLNTTDRLGTGGDLGTRTVATPLGTVSLDLNFLNAPLRWFGFVILASSLLIAARIIIGGATA